MKRDCLCLLGLLLLLTALAGCGESNKPTRSIDFVPLNSIEITSQNPQAAAGTTNRFTAIGHYGGPSTFQFTRNITGQVSWTSSDPSVLSFSSDPALAGFATAAAAGTVTVTATLDGVSADLPFTVSAATISSLTITSPASATLVAGKTLQLRVVGTFSDGSSQDLTDAAAWSSSDTGVATVPGAGLVSAVAQGTADITASFGGQSATQTVEVSGAALESLAVTTEGTSATLAQNTTLQLTATGTYSDGSTQDLTGQVTWASSNTAVAAIDQNPGTTGLLSALTPSSTQVTASYQGVDSPALTITVSSATLTDLSISPASPTVTVGDTLQLTATGEFSDGSSQDLTRDVAWSSADTTIATVSVSTDMEGTAKGIAAGTATITADSSGIPTTTGLTLSATAELSVQ